MSSTEIVLLNVDYVIPYIKNNVKPNMNNMQCSRVSAVSYLAEAYFVVAARKRCTCTECANEQIANLQFICKMYKVQFLQYILA